MRGARAVHGLDTAIEHLPNPRVEKEDHYYNAKHQRLIDLGLQPHLLRSTLINSVIETVERHRERVDVGVLQSPNVDWKTGAVKSRRLIGLAQKPRTPAQPRAHRFEPGAIRPVA